MRTKKIMQKIVSFLKSGIIDLRGSAVEIPMNIVFQQQVPGGMFMVKGLSLTGNWYKQKDSTHHLFAKKSHTLLLSWSGYETFKEVIAPRRGS